VEEQVVSTVQKGAIGEAIIAAWLAIGSDGRLSCFSPIADDGGIDLLAYDKHTGRSWPIQVKTRTKTITKNIVHFQVRRATFNAWPNAFLIAALMSYETTKLSVRRAWLVPMGELAQVGKVSENKIVIRPSWAEESKDKYTKYRCQTMSDLVDRLLHQS